MKLRTRGSRGLDEVVACVVARVGTDSGLAGGDVDRLLGAVERAVDLARGASHDSAVDVAFEWDDEGVEIAVGSVDLEEAAPRTDGRLTVRECRDGGRVRVAGGGDATRRGACPKPAGKRGG